MAVTEYMKTIVDNVEECFPTMYSNIGVQELYDMFSFIGKATGYDTLYSYGFYNGYKRLNSIKIFNSSISFLVEICEYNKNIPVKKDILRRVTFLLHNPSCIDREENPLENIIFKVIDIWTDSKMENKISVFNRDIEHKDSPYMINLLQIFKMNFRFPDNVYDSFKRSVLYAVKTNIKEAIL